MADDRDFLNVTSTVPIAMGRQHAPALPLLEDALDGPEGPFLLLISSEGCDACERMTAALLELLSTDDGLCPAFRLAPTASFGQRLATYQVSTLPTLILFRNGEEEVRWGGFFDLPADEAREQMRAILMKALSKGGEAR